MKICQVAYTTIYLLATCVPHQSTNPTYTLLPHILSRTAGKSHHPSIAPRGWLVLKIFTHNFCYYVCWSQCDLWPSAGFSHPWRTTSFKTYLGNVWLQNDLDASKVDMTVHYDILYMYVLSRPKFCQVGSVISSFWFLIKNSCYKWTWVGVSLTSSCGVKVICVEPPPRSSTPSISGRLPRVPGRGGTVTGWDSIVIRQNREWLERKCIPPPPLHTISTFSFKCWLHGSFLSLQQT